MELSEVHHVVAICEFSTLKGRLKTHGNFSAEHAYATAIHASAAAEYAEEHWRNQPNHEVALESVRCALGAAVMLEYLGVHDEACANRVRARNVLESLDALPERSPAEVVTLRHKLTEAERDADLSRALVAMLKGDGDNALDYAKRWPDSWVSQCIQFTASLFLHYDEPARAAHAFGSLEALHALVQANCVERHFLHGMGALFLGNQDAAIASLRAAAELEPNDPFVLCAFAYVCARCNAPQDELEAARARFAALGSMHPLLGRAGTLPEWS